MTTVISGTSGITFPDTSIQGTTGLGFDPQTWSNQTSSRAFSSTYTNSTGRPIAIKVQINCSATCTAALAIAGTTIVTYGNSASFSPLVVDGIIPVGATYSITTTGTTTLTSWFELR
jgi:hypothetical protein